MILDTNALSDFADGERSMLDQLGQATLHLPVIVLGEYRFGIRRSQHRAKYEDWLQRTLPLLVLLPVTESTTSHYAAICDQLRTAGTPIPSNDAWIAAIAVEHSLPILSRDKHFDHVAGVIRQTW
jgi:predicted nucleic acid-binding protein